MQTTEKAQIIIRTYGGSTKPAAIWIFRNHTERLLISASTRCATNFSVSICKNNHKEEYPVKHIMNGVHKKGSQGLQTHLGQLSRIIWFRMKEQLQEEEYFTIIKEWLKVQPGSPTNQKKTRISELETCFLMNSGKNSNKADAQGDSWAEILSIDTPSRWRPWISWMKDKPNIRNHA